MEETTVCGAAPAVAGLGIAGGEAEGAWDSVRGADGAITAAELATLPAIISKHEVARLARVSERTVVREAGKGNLDGAFRVANVWRFSTARICEQFGLVR